MANKTYEMKPCSCLGKCKLKHKNSPSYQAVKQVGIKPLQVEETACVGTSKYYGHIYATFLCIYLKGRQQKFHMQVNKSGHAEMLFPLYPLAQTHTWGSVTQQIRFSSPRHSQDSGGCFSWGSIISSSKIK